MGKIKLTRPTFMLLHKLVLEKFQFNCEEEGWDFSKFGNYQIYGYADYATNKPNLPSSLKKNKRIREYLKQKQQKDPQQKKPEVNGQYLYSRFVKFRSNPFAPPVVLAGIYSRIYFLYLDLTNLQAFLEKAEEGNLLSAEEISVQRSLMDESSPLVGLNEYIHTFGFVYYSKKLNGNYLLNLTINFTPGLVSTKTERYPSYEVKAEEMTPPPGFRKKHYKGIAVYEKKALAINLEATDDQENLYIIMAAGELEGLTKRSIFEGSYVGRSREYDVISGQAYLYRLNGEKGRKQIPELIEKRLLSRKRQVRTDQTVLNEDWLVQKLESTGYGSLLDTFAQKTFRLFVMNNSYQLQQIALQIGDDYSYKMVITENRQYQGRVRILPQSQTLCFESTKPITQKDDSFFSVAFVDVSDYTSENLDPQNPPLLQGSFCWGQWSLSPFHGHCYMVESPELPPSLIIHPDDLEDQYSRTAHEKLLQSRSSHKPRKRKTKVKNN